MLANTSTILQQAAQTAYQQSSPSCLTQKPLRKASLFTTENTGEFSGGKKSGERTISRKMTRTERPAGLGRRTREETGKGNQRLSWDSRQEDDIRHPQPPSGGYKTETWYKKIYVNKQIEATESAIESKLSPTTEDEDLGYEANSLSRQGTDTVNTNRQPLGHDESVWRLAVVTQYRTKGCVPLWH